MMKIEKTGTTVHKTKLVMTLLVRNEEAIVRYNIDFHLAKGVDFIIATDNGSTDGTRDILREYEKRGVLYLIDEQTQNYNQAEWNNRMAQIARDQFAADIIFHCDADEFWHPRSGNLKHEITSRPEDILSVDLINILLADRDGAEAFPEDARYAVVNPLAARNYEEETKEVNMFYFKYPSKVLFKTAKKLLLVSQGNHTVTNPDDSITEGKSRDIVIYHYPLRSKSHFFQKTIDGGSAYEKNTTQSKGIGFHKRRWYDSYKNGLLDVEYKKLIIDRKEVDKLLRDGFIEEMDFKEIIQECKKDQSPWRYYNRRFEYEEMFRDFDWPWAGHKHFAYDLIRNTQPQVIVELGTHRGTSFFSFCQAVKDARYNASLYAVDTWQGDDHSGFYDDQVFNEVNEIREKYYGGLNIRLLRKSFDEAVNEFENHSIDLLHIDGLHTYAAVKHDFEKWLPKVRQQGIILLHDIFISRDDFGVYKLWEELKNQYRTLEFHHSYGLGVLFKAGVRRPSFPDKEREWQIRYSYMAEDKKNEEIRKSFSEQSSQTTGLAQAVAERDALVTSLNQALAEREGQIAAILSSRSWRITAPLRMIGTKFRQMINRVAIAKAVGSITRNYGLRAGYRLFRGRRLLLRSGAFDANYYLRQNPDVAAARIDPALHFMMHGVREGRNPNAFFDTNWYLRQNPDVAKAGLNPLVHYIQFGADEGRDPSSRFSGSAYLAANPDGLNPLLHYLKFGMSEGRLLRAWSAREAPVQRGQEIVSTWVSNELSARLHSIDVIVCVHNALEDVKLCLESVVANTLPPYRLIIVDDGSDHETQEFLEKFIVGQPAMLIRNEIATGYTKAANTGLRASSAEMVVLLNSDTIVPPRWLDRLVRCALSDDHVGLVGPLSNTASWQSVPQIFNEQGDWADNLLPDGWNVKDFSNEVARISQCIFPRVGFLNGFCLLIKRAVINDIGLFDEVTFAHGYSEENDYCLRAVQKNWQLAVADDCFVFHAQSKSYTHDRRQELVSLAGMALVVKHGQERVNAQLAMTRYHPALEYIRKRCKHISSLRRIRDEMLHRFEGKRVLFLLPVGTIGGGGNIVLLESATMREIGVDAWIANLLVNRELFEQHHPNLNVPVLYLSTPDELLEYAQAFDVIIATLYLTVFWMEPLLSLEQRPRLGYYIQDFEPYFFQEGSSDYQQALSSYSAIPEIRLFTKTQWNCSVLKERLGLDPVIIGPSLNVNAFHPSANYYGNLYPVRIVAMVRPSTPRRAPEMTMRVLKRLKQRFQHQIVILIFGVRCDDPNFLKLECTFEHQCLGELTAEQLKDVLMHSDIFVDCSTFQAMGLTAMEAMASGTVVVGPLNGGLTEIVENEKTGLLIDTQDEDQIISAVSRLTENYELRHRMGIAAFDVLKNVPDLSVYRLLTYLFCDDE